MKLYGITDWKQRYEFGDFSRLKKREWYPKRCSHDGLKYKTVMRLKRGPEVYLAFTLMEAVAAKSSRPGVLCDSTGVALTANDLYIITECPAEVFEYAFPLLVQVGWIQVLEETPEKIREIPRPPEKIRLQDKTEQDRTEHISLPEQPAKTKTKPENPDPQKHGYNIGQLFVDAYKKFGRGSDYRIDGPDANALRSLYKTFRQGEEKLVKKCIELYLYDASKFLQEMRWKLEYMPKHVNKYIAQAKTPAPETQSNANEATDDPYDTYAGEFDKDNRANASA